MAEEFQYQKERQKFGRHAQFEDTETRIVGSVAQNKDQAESFYVLRDPNKIVLDNIPQMSEHRVNTERIPTQNRGMKHNVGGWPAQFDCTEPNEVAKYMRRLQKEPQLGFAPATKDLVGGATRCIRQNNQLDLFEEYFEGEEPEHMSEPITTKTIMIFKDPNSIKRAVTKIAWHPETTELRVGTTYAQLRFQQQPPNMPKESYIWNLNNPNTPEKTLDPTSPLCTLAFSQKLTDNIAAGAYNGSLQFFDMKRGSSDGKLKPYKTTILEQSHHDPVYDIYWCAGKTGTELVSTSTDGRILWWDTKMLDNGPTEELVLEEHFDIGGEKVSKVLGGTCLEYNAEHSALKFLVGTEQGFAIQASRRQKKVEVTHHFGTEAGKHHGPIYACQRNPANLKYFLTVGDWSAKIWCEEHQQHPIMQTRYHNAYLTDGCWSPTRTGLFFLTRTDGFLDVWDFYYRQNEVAYSQKVSDCMLTSISIAAQMAAIGDADGTVSMTSLSRNLWDPSLQPNEKDIMAQIFDREFRREKQLHQNKVQAAKALKAKVAKEGPSKEKVAQKLEQELAQIEEEFFNQVSENPAEMEAIKSRKMEQQDGGAVAEPLGEGQQ